MIKVQVAAERSAGGADAFGPPLCLLPPARPFTYIRGMTSPADDYLIRPDPLDPRLTERVKGVDQTGATIETSVIVERALTIFLTFQRDTGHAHPHRDAVTANYRGLLAAMGRTEAEIDAELAALWREAGLA